MGVLSACLLSLQRARRNPLSHTHFSPHAAPHAHPLYLFSLRYLLRNPSDAGYLKFMRMDMVTFNILGLPADWVAQHDGFGDASRTAPKPGAPFLLNSHDATEPETGSEKDSPSPRSPPLLYFSFVAMKLKLLRSARERRTSIMPRFSALAR